MAIFDDYEVASWEVDGGAGRLTFAVEVIEERYANRLKPHKRVDRDGARQEDTGADFTVWTLTGAYYNSDLHEEGVDGLSQYPDNVNAMSEACKVHATGTLVIPTVGPRRCRLASYRRIETRQQGVDLAAVVYTFHEDNEDDARQQAARIPSAASVAERIVIDAVVLCERAGANNFDLSDLAELAAQLEDMANAPGDFIAGIEAKSNAVANKIESVERAFTDAGREGLEETSALLTDPENSRAGRLLRRAGDVARRAPLDKAAVRFTSRAFAGVVSIFDVATETKQDASRLMEINPQLPDYLEIPAGTAVRVEVK